MFLDILLQCDAGCVAGCVAVRVTVCVAVCCRITTGLGETTFLPKPESVGRRSVAVCVAVCVAMCCNGLQCLLQGVAVCCEITS